MLPPLDATTLTNLIIFFQEATSESLKPGPSSADASDGVGVDDNDVDDDTEPSLKRKRFGKNPDVDTSFLPDVERDEEENRLREKLRQVRTLFFFFLLLCHTGIRTRGGTSLGSGSKALA